MSFFVSSGKAAPFDVLFLDDLYRPAFGNDEGVERIEINQSLLAGAVIDGKVTIDNATQRDGTETLRFGIQKGQRRSTIHWTEKVEPGRYYRFSAVCRNMSRTPDDPPEFLGMYGFLQIQWLDAQGARIPVRDKLMSRPGAETFWNAREVKALSPPGTAEARLTITAGSHIERDDLAMWFGNLRWEQLQPSPIKLDLRPRVLRNAQEVFKIEVSRTAQWTVTSDSRLKIELLDATGKVHRYWDAPNLITLPWITPLKLPDGVNEGWTVRVRTEPIRPHVGQTSYEISEPVLIANSRLDRRLDDGWFVMDNRRRFLIGAYHAKPQDYSVLKKAGFNTVICKSYDASEAVKRFDHLAKLGLYGFMSLGGGGQTRANVPRVQGVIKALKDHPALLAWDLLDEPTRKGVGPREIAWYGCWVQSLSPQVPTIFNCAGPYVFDRFAGTTDVFSVDPYPIYTWSGYDESSPDLGQVSQWLNLARQLTPEGRGVLGVVECFTFDKKNQPAASGSELRNMVYQVLASGANGLMYYSVHDLGWNLLEERLFEEIVRLNNEIQHLEKYLVTGPLDADECVLSFDGTGIDRLVSASWREQSGYLTMLINLDRHSQKINVKAQQNKDFRAKGVQLPETIELKGLEVVTIEYNARQLANN